jgi:hypothetical protein
MMLNEHAQMWVDALVSGDYTQTRGTLTDANGDCCLGVACKVAIAAGVPVKVEVVDSRPTSYTKYDGESKYLPASVRSWLGLTSDNGGFEDELGADTLADLNDAGNTLAEIAAIIRANADELFD